MTLSPKKYVSHFTSSTTNKGVVAREIELCNMNLSLSNQSHSGSSRTLEAAHALPLGDSRSHNSTQLTDETSSYIQVVVQKQHRKMEPLQVGAAQTSPRLPAASSPLSKENFQKQAPLYQAPDPQVGVEPMAAHPPGMYVLQHPMLLPYPTAPPHQGYIEPIDVPSNRWQSEPSRPSTTEAACDARNSSSFKKLVTGQRGKIKYKPNHETTATVKAHASSSKGSVWKKLSKVGRPKFSPKDTDPDTVEVFYMERAHTRYMCGAESRATALGPHVARAERCLERGCAELLVIPTCLVNLPISLLLQVFMAGCGAARRLLGGAVGVVGAALVKPLLAAGHNALVAPLCACVGAAGRAGRLAARPLQAALGDLLAPAASLLAAPRLVSVRVAR